MPLIRDLKTQAKLPPFAVSALPVKMDIKTLLVNLHEEVSCSVCMRKFTDPKQLPCLHSFCLHCLNGIQQSSANPNVVACPECRQDFRVPGNGNLGALPTNVRINNLLDILAIKECDTTGVECGNCDKKSEHSFYCFQCCAFWCDDCIGLHNGIRANKEHHALALKDFKDQDFENILKQPAFCGVPGHGKKELEFFCRSCEVAICYSCVAILHEGHPKMLLDEAANERKLHVKAAIESQKERVIQKSAKIAKIRANCDNIEVQVKRVNKDIQMFVDSIIVALEAKKQELFIDVENRAQQFLMFLNTQECEVESQVKVIETQIGKTEQLLERSTNTEIAQLDTNTVFQEGDCKEEKQVDRVLENIRHFAFMQNESLMEKLSVGGIGSFRSFLSKTSGQQSTAEGKGIYEATEGLEAPIVVTTRTAGGVQCYKEHDFVKVEIRNSQGRNCVTKAEVVDKRDGTYKISYFANEAGTCDASVIVNGEHVQGSPFKVQVKPRQFKPVLLFGEEGSSFGRFNSPWGVSVNSERNEIAVTDRMNHRVLIFRSDGSFLRSFGSKGDQKGQFDEPTGIVFHNNNIVVADRNNHRVQVLSAEGKFVGQFGGEGDLDHQLKLPLGLSADCEGNIIVADSNNRSVKIFSPWGQFLRKIDKNIIRHPFHCIQYDNYLFVSDGDAQGVKVFDKEGRYMYKFGHIEDRNRALVSPRCLSVNKVGDLMVCDIKHGVEVFKISGKFLTWFGRDGRGKGEFEGAFSTAVLGDGKVVVCDFTNHGIQVFE